MTKKEIVEVQVLLSAVRSAAFDIERYCDDFDSTTLKSTADDLRKALEKFRKSVKI